MSEVSRTCFGDKRVLGPIGVGAQATLRGQVIFVRKNVWKINKLLEFYMSRARKNYQNTPILWYLPDELTKIPNFTWFLNFT